MSTKPSAAFPAEPELFELPFDREEVDRALEELYYAKRCLMERPAEAYIYVERAIDALEHV